MVKGCIDLIINLRFVLPKMRTVILIMMCLSLSYVSAHQYFFSFAEIEYNDVSERFEATITATTHDIEKSLSLELNTTILLDDSDKFKKEVENYLGKHFQIIMGDVKSQFSMIGHEISMNGTVNFYLESEPIKYKPVIAITFDLLMKDYPEQQNKITFYHRDRSYTRPFLDSKRTQTIILETEIK